MKKTRRIFLLLFVFLLCFQFLGLEGAICDDSVIETSCQDCVNCVLNSLVGLQTAVSLPTLQAASSAFFQESSQFLEEPTFNFFHPPISRA